MRTQVPYDAGVADPIFADRRLAPLYDAFDSDRSDLDAYAAIVDELGARSVLDVGCGTGTFACMLAQRGVDVIGVDPAAESIEVARGKACAERVRWIVSDAASLPQPVTEPSPLREVDLAVMTANVAQVFLTDEDWMASLRGIRSALRPEGTLVFETRDPARRGWDEWNRSQVHAVIDLPGIGTVEQWCDLVEVDLPFVSFRFTCVFGSDGAVVTSDSTLRFRERDELESSLVDAGFRVEDVRDAPDRPGREFVFLARRV